MTTEDLLNYFYTKDTILLDGRNGSPSSSSPTSWSACKATRDIRDPHGNELIVKEGRKITKASLQQMEAAGIERDPDRRSRRSLGRVSAHDVVDPKTGEVLLECNQEITTEKLDRLRAARHRARSRCCFIDDTHIGPSLRNTLLQDKIAVARGGDPRDLQAPAPGRSADPRDRDDVLQQPVLQPRALRSVARRPPEAQPPPRPRRAARAGHAAPRGHPRGRPLPDRAEERQRPDRRHRPPRQPPRARGRRAGREPVPHRPGPHGARHQGAHEPAGHRDADAAGAHQLQAGVGGHQGVLRVQSSSRSSWTRRTRSPRSRTSAASPRSAPAV